MDERKLNGPLKHIPTIMPAFIRPASRIAPALLALCVVAFSSPVSALQPPTASGMSGTPPLPGAPAFPQGDTEKNGNGNTAPAQTNNGTPAPATDSTPADSPPEETLAAESVITADTVRKQIESAEQDSSLDTTVKGLALEAFRAALEELQLAETFGTLEKKFKATPADIEAKSNALKQELEQLPKQLPLDIDEKKATSADLEQLVAKTEAELRDIETRKSEFERVTAQRPSRRKDLIESQTTLPSRMKEVQEKITALPDANASQLVNNARMTQYQAALIRLKAEEGAIREELNLYDLQKANRFTTLGLELATTRQGLYQKKLESLRHLVTQKKRNEAQAQLAELKKDTDTTYPVLQSHINEIETYTKQMTQLVELNDQAEDQKEETTVLLKEIQEDERVTMQKDQGPASQTEAFALSLLRQLYELPNVDAYRERHELHTNQLNEATFQQIDIQAESNRLLTIDKAVDESFEKIKEDLGEDDLGFFEQGLRNDLKRLIQQKKESLENLKLAYDKYGDTLIELTTQEQLLIETVDNYRSLIRKRIFWIRSDSVLSISDLRRIFDISTYGISFADIQELPQLYLNDVRRDPIINAIGLMLLILLFLLRFQARRELTGLAEQARKSSNSRILPTLRALLLTAIIAAPIPLTMWFLGWRLGSMEITNNLQLALSQTLQQLGVIFGLLEFFRQCCRRDGLVDAHFNGPNLLASRFQRHSFLLLVVLVPIFFVISLLGHLNADETRQPLERVLFCIGMLIAAGYAHTTLHPQGPLMREVFLMKSAGPISRSRWFWFPLANIGPVILAVMAWLGYYYTAVQLSWRLLLTLLLLATVMLVWGVALRWYRMAQRWFRINIMRERLKQSNEETQTLEGQKLKLERDAQINDEDREKQTLKLINYGMLLPLFIGLWSIWADVLPAVAHLDELKIWSTWVDQTVVENGNPSTRKVEEIISPVDITISILAIMVTVFLSRNMPGMFDFVLLQRIGIDASLRYALTSVIGYLLTFIGFAFAFGKLGFRWEQIQWLAAALTFGLSFGLQEIFANFISGLIILFERPVRIGDIVTIEGVTGVVTRIRIRASTITDWDRKEFLVPNKELVTGRVLNWTLSDTLNRIVVPVGVAYGTDTDRVREILFEIAKDEKEILTEPQTLVTFEAFGDSTLNFVMRAYLASLDNRLETIHKLHTRIHQRFMQEGIEIAFPQQDLHIRTIPPSWQTQKPGPKDGAGGHTSGGNGDGNGTGNYHTSDSASSVSSQGTGSSGTP